ncbi:MAG: hypothetical protein R3C24_18125 [Cyanobacteriota/Melainabacteria group bacterium]
MNYARKQKEILERLEALSWAGESPASSVPLSSDFETDARLCLTFLSFLPSAIKETVTTLIEELKALDKNQYYYRPESLHITIQNVRRIADPPTFTAADITAADRAFQESIAEEKLKPIRFHLSGLLLLPTSLAVTVFTDKTYGDFVKALRQNLTKHKIPDNKSYISDDIVFGNITIARFGSPPSTKLKERVTELKESFSGGEYLAEDICLVTTSAVCHPEFTTIRQSYKLK